MSLDRISTTVIKEKLLNLGDTTPEIVKDFSRNLADRLNCEITPSGFVATAAMLLMDLRRGYHHYTRERIENGLTYLGMSTYIALGEYVPLIAEQVCPDDFSQKVMAIFEGKDLYRPRKLSRKF